MKIIATTLFLFAVIATPAIAADEGFYAGVSAGYANIDPPSTFGSTNDDTDTVFGVIAGYQFNKTWGVEMEYTGAGKFKAPIATGKADILGITGVATLPLSGALSMYGKLGVTEAFGKGSGVARDTNRTAATYGLGLQYDMTQSTGIRVGWDRFNTAISSPGSDHNYNSDVFSAAAVYKF